MKSTMYMNGQPVAWAEFPDPPECSPEMAFQQLERAIDTVLIDAYRALPWWRRAMVRMSVARIRPRPRD